MRLFGLIDEKLDRHDRASLLTPPFDFLTFTGIMHLFVLPSVMPTHDRRIRGRTIQSRIPVPDIRLLQPEQVTRDLWRIRWVSALEGPFYVYRDGVLVVVTWSKQVHAWAEEDEEGSIIDVYARETDVPPIVRSSRFELRWGAVAETDHYRVEKYVDEAWALERAISSHGDAPYVYRSDFVGANEAAEYRVLPVGTNGVEGDAVSFTKHAVRHPYQPSHTMAFNDGEGTVTLTE